MSGKSNRKQRIIEYVKEYYEQLEGKDWWNKVAEYLKESYGYPKVYKLLDSPAEDITHEFHPVFRPLLISIIPPSSESSMTKTIVAKGRSNLLKARVPPHYVGLRCPAFQSRSRGNFGVVGMVPDNKYGYGIFSRAVLNVPYFNKQKIKRLVLGCYGLAKHGKSLDELPQFLEGGVFLLNPEKDPEFEKLTPYVDYHYVPLKVRLPKNYDEFIKTLDGSVLISKSAAEKLKYLHIAFVDLMNPVPSIREKFLLFTKKNIKRGAKVHFQEPLSIARIGNQELAVNTSPIEGYVYDYREVTPRVKDEKRKVYLVTLVDERPAELGCKLESATGLKNTVGGYTDDKEPTIVINPDTLKDRSLYWEIKKTGKAHVYVTIPGKDGNISNKNVRISNTFIQTIFMFPPEVQKKIIEQVFSPENIILNVPENILDIIENFDINPEKYPIFYPQLYYVRKIKKKNKKGETIIYYSEQLSHFGRAVEALFKEVNKMIKSIGVTGKISKKLRQKLIDKAYDRLPKYYKEPLDNWTKQMIARLIIGDPHKSTQIRIRGWLRITLFKSSPEVNEIEISPELWEKMGKPEYVIWGKEPLSRPESMRCLKVKVSKELKGQEQVVRIHPFLGMDYDSGEMNAKVDSDGDLSILIPIKEPIPELMYPVKKKKFKTVNEMLKKYKSFEDLPEPPYNYTPEELAKELTCYNRYLTQEAQVIELFGGLKNHAMYTDIIKDWKRWLEFTKEYDIEAKALQLEKFHPELKDASYCIQAEYLAELVHAARQEMRKIPERDEFAQQWLKLSSQINFKNRYKIREMIKALKKQKHPVLQLYWKIYENSPLKI